MKIALIGYGNMGQELGRFIEEQKKHEIASVSFRNMSDSLDKAGIKKADIAIDFTSPEIIEATIKTVARIGIPIVVGTTGWYDKLPKVKKIVEKNKIGLIYGGNFSIGANIFFSVVEHAGMFCSKYSSYDVFGYEIHHTGKKDSPSGTARKLASLIMKNFPTKKTLQTEKLDRKIQSSELHFASIRGGRNPGLHEVIFDSLADEIRLVHYAHGRRGFAEGAIMAAEFIKNKKGLYEFADLFKKRK